MAVGAADPWWPPSGGALPAPNNERKGLAPTLPLSSHCLYQLQDCWRKDVPAVSPFLS